MIDKYLIALTVLVAVAVSHRDGAQAADDEKPAQDGSDIGVAAGILPPPGVYGSLQTTHTWLTVKTGDGTDTASKIASHGLDAGFLWVPNVKIFGATYGVGAFQPVRDQTVTSAQSSHEVAGIANTMLNVSTFSWDFGRGLHVSMGANLYVNDIAYTSGKSPVVGHNYMTYEPHAALTYLLGDWAMTGSVLFDLNTPNRANQYLSGNNIVVDLTALRTIDRWELGLGSQIDQQVSADRRAGLVVPAMPNGHARGNRAREVTLGPIAGYNFGTFNVQAYYQKSISAANVAAGFEVGLRANFPIYTSASLSPAELDAVGKR